MKPMRLSAFAPAQSTGIAPFAPVAKAPSDRVPTGLGEQDLYLLSEGTHARLFDKFGCHFRAEGGADFRVWAPNARSVSVIGDWNGWDAGAHPLTRQEGQGIWQGFVPTAEHGQRYKYHVIGAGGQAVDKADPYAHLAEEPSATASRAWNLDYAWGDADWMRDRAQRNALSAPISVYEVHFGSWRRHDDGEPLSYRELAPALGDYVSQMGFTHVELMPITEHPFYGSWGYLTTGYFAPTSRYGTPQDFMYLVDHLHQRGIGVLLDWVPSHFPTDEHGLQYFDGTHLYEHADPRQGFHPDWKSSIFNYGRGEVRSFLISSALFWLEKYHLDGLRVDAVASMLYLDYGRKDGEWIPNAKGGKENLEAISFLQALNEAVYREHPDVMMVAEESTAWPQVSRPTGGGGLGFGMKWNMGWMHDTLSFLQADPVHRKYHLGQLTFSLVYAFSENFMLPLSHDEVVHGKGSLISRMPGDPWQQFANLRLLYALMWTHPGKKLLFMGSEFAQRHEWTHEGQLDWAMAQQPEHHGIQRLVQDLNRLYRQERALHEVDFSAEGFEWIDAQDATNTVIAYMRYGASGQEPLLVVVNLTPIPRQHYRIGVPRAGHWREVLNTDVKDYGGSGWGNLGGLSTAAIGAHGRAQSLELTLPPLSVLIFKHDDPTQRSKPALQSVDGPSSHGTASEPLQEPTSSNLNTRPEGEKK